MDIQLTDLHSTEGTSLGLNINGATSTVNNGTQVSSFIAQRDADSLSSSAYMAAGGPGIAALVTLYDQNGVATIQLQGGSDASKPILVINGNQVIAARQTGPGDATDTADVVARFNSLLAVLRTHGLIT